MQVEHTKISLSMEKPLLLFKFWKLRRRSIKGIQIRYRNRPFEKNQSQLSNSSNDYAANLFCRNWMN